MRVPSKPPHITVKLRPLDGVVPLFSKVNVELLPTPEPMSLTIRANERDLIIPYDPAPLIREIIESFASVLCPQQPDLIRFMEQHHCGKREAKKALAELFCEKMRRCVSTACNYARRQIETHLEESFKSLFKDAIYHTVAVLIDKVFERESLEEFIKGRVKEYRKRLRQLLNLNTQGGKRNFNHNWTDIECLTLASFYSGMLPVWKQAKAMYKKYPEKYEKELVKQHLILPEHLVKRLASLDPYESMSSNLAILDAALELGLERDKYSPEQLHRYRKRGERIAVSNFWSVEVWI